MARVLGIADYADVALRGYEGIRDGSFLIDGFSVESPSYTDMYLGDLVEVPRRSTASAGRRIIRAGPVPSTSTATIRNSSRCIARSPTPADRMAGTFRSRIPMRSGVRQESGSEIHEIAMRRWPEYFGDRVRAIYRYRGAKPGEYAISHLDMGMFETADGPDLVLPEGCFPAWMTAILRHGAGPDGSTIALPFNPPGGHRHADNLALWYADRGRTILGDQGYLSAAPIQRWIGSTESHNLVIIDGRGQKVQPRSRPDSRSPHDGDHTPSLRRRGVFRLLRRRDRLPAPRRDGEGAGGWDVRDRHLPRRGRTRTRLARLQRDRVESRDERVARLRGDRHAAGRAGAGLRREHPRRGHPRPARFGLRDESARLLARGRGARTVARIGSG